MSRYSIKPKDFSNITIVIGFEDMPMGGYFIQVYDENHMNEEDEGIILNEGFCPGLNKSKMIEIFDEQLSKYQVYRDERIKDFLLTIALDLPI